MTAPATAPASISVPSRSATPETRPPFTRTAITSAPVVISTPRARASFAIASLIAPIPPRACPQVPRFPSALSVHFAECVVQEHVGRAGRIGAREMPDLRVESEHRLDRIAFEPVVEQVARAAGDELPQVALAGALKAREPPAQSERAQPGAPTSSQIGRRFENKGAQRIRSGFDGAVVIGQALRVTRRKSGQLPLRIGKCRSQPERAAVGQRQEIRERTLDDVQAVIGEPELAYDFRIEEAHRVGGSGVAEAGCEFLGDGRAADDGAALEHPYLETGAGEIARAHQAVVTAADDDDVVRHETSAASRSGRRRDCRRSSQTSSRAGRGSVQRARSRGYGAPRKRTRNRRS